MFTFLIRCAEVVVFTAVAIVTTKVVEELLKGETKAE